MSNPAQRKRKAKKKVYDLASFNKAIELQKSSVQDDFIPEEFLPDEVVNAVQSAFETDKPSRDEILRIFRLNDNDIEKTINEMQANRRDPNTENSAAEVQRFLIDSITSQLTKKELQVINEEDIIIALLGSDGNIKNALEKLRAQIHSQSSETKPSIDVSSSVIPSKSNVVVDLSEPNENVERVLSPIAVKKLQVTNFLLLKEDDEEETIEDENAITDEKETSKDSFQFTLPIPASSPLPSAAKMIRQHTLERRTALKKALQTRHENSQCEVSSVIVVGHVDAGKSTLLGHLLVLLGHVSNQVIQRYQKESEQSGKSSFHFAWVMDTSEAERSRGVTVDISHTFARMGDRSLSLIDAPGHRDFVPNMIAGAQQCDGAVLVINSRPSEFETGFADNGQTKEHALLLKSLGVNQLIVAINQLDKANWSSHRYDEIVTLLEKFLLKSGFSSSSISFVPVSGFTGDNLTVRSSVKEFQWYKGPTLLELLEKIEPQEHVVDAPLRFCVNESTKTDRPFVAQQTSPFPIISGSSIVTGSGVSSFVISGTVATGMIGIGDRVTIMPSFENAIVKTIVTSSGVSVEVGGPGEILDVYLSNDSYTINPGSFLCDPINPIPVTNRFRAQLLAFSLEFPITIGFTCAFYCNNMCTEASICKIIGLIDKTTKQVDTNSPPRLIHSWSRFEAEIVLNQRVCIESFTRVKSLSRFTLRSGGRTCAGGIVSSLLIPTALFSTPTVSPADSLSVL